MRVLARGRDALRIYDPDRLARRYSFQELVMDELRELGIETLFGGQPPISRLAINNLLGNNHQAAGSSVARQHEQNRGRKRHRVQAAVLARVATVAE
jgi:hypothetical protein